MATISSVGTAGRTYSDPAAWLVAFAAGGWEGECYPDSVFSTATSFSGHATSGTDYIILRCASGQSWRDNASVQTNPFAYDSTKGVAFSAGTGVTAITIAENFVTVSGLQIANTANSTPVVNNTQNLTNSVVENCIIESGTTTGIAVQWRSGLFRNNLVIKRATGTGAGISVPSGATNARIINCTIARVSNVAASGTGISGPTSTSFTVQSCAIFGFTTAISGTATFTGGNNASDVAIGSFGSGNQSPVTYANQFVTTTDTGRDFKTKTGADLLNNAVTDTTNIPAAIDAAGTARPQGAAWDIGAWELVTSSNPTFAFLGSGTPGLTSASTVGLTGAGVANLIMAASLGAAGIGTVNALMAAKLGSAGVGTFTAMPAGSASFGIAGTSAASFRAAMVIRAAGVGGFNPLPLLAATAFTMAGLCTVRFNGSSFYWTPTTPAAPGWTAGSAGSDLWTKHPSGSSAWDRTR